MVHNAGKNNSFSGVEQNYFCVVVLHFPDINETSKSKYMMPVSVNLRCLLKSHKDAFVSCRCALAIFHKMKRLQKLKPSLLSNRI